MMGGAKAHYDGIKAFSETDFNEDLKNNQRSGTVRFPSVERFVWQTCEKHPRWTPRILKFRLANWYVFCLRSNESYR